jgi:ATP-dependent exoDNAse (exonuclease V) alpha subunit
MDDAKTLYTGKIYAPQFGATTPVNFTQDRIKAKDGDLFDFGYALTVHKAQGSQAKRVVLFEERFAKMDDDQWKRWLYTGVTRAEEELYIFGPANN